MRKILIAVPCMDAVPAQFAHSLSVLTSYGIEDTQISVWFNLGSLIYTSRNEIAKRALLDEAELVMWFDSDMVFNPDTLSRLLKHIDDGADMMKRNKRLFGLSLMESLPGFLKLLLVALAVFL